MRLFHGSNVLIDSINLAMCRPYKDFGEQTTEEWAKFVLAHEKKDRTRIQWIGRKENYSLKELKKQQQDLIMR